MWNVLVNWKKAIGYLYRSFCLARFVATIGSIVLMIHILIRLGSDGYDCIVWLIICIAWVLLSSTPLILIFRWDECVVISVETCEFFRRILWMTSLVLYFGFNYYQGLNKHQKNEASFMIIMAIIEDGLYVLFVLIYLARKSHRQKADDIIPTFPKFSLPMTTVWPSHDEKE